MRAWTVSDVKAGTLTQCLGVARHFDLDPHRIILKDRLPRWAVGPFSPYRHLPEPEPDLIVSCGSFAPKHVFAIVDRLKRKPFTVHLQPPEPEFSKRYDMVFVGRHDWSPESEEQKYFPMVTAPHQIRLDDLIAMRASAREKWVPAGGEALAVLVGGPTKAFGFDAATVESLCQAVETQAEAGWTVLASTSRRSPPELLDRLLKLRSDRIRVWDRMGGNPYREFLAAADAFLVTADTVTMTAEALATGRPVYIFPLPGIASYKLDKFQRFHTDLAENLKLTRPFQGTIEKYSYTPVDEAARISKMVGERLASASRR